MMITNWMQQKRMTDTVQVDRMNLGWKWVNVGKYIYILLVKEFFCSTVLSKLMILTSFSKLRFPLMTNHKNKSDGMSNWRGTLHL